MSDATPLPPSSPRTYPLPRPKTDPRFTLGLVFDVARVIAEHGYPKLEAGLDFVELEQALFKFLYADPPPMVCGAGGCGHPTTRHEDTLGCLEPGCLCSLSPAWASWRPEDQRLVPEPGTSDVDVKGGE